MKDKEIELVELPVSFKTAEQSRRTYLSVDEVQRNAGQYFFRRYFCVFKCGNKVYALREHFPSSLLPSSISLPIALTQLSEIFLKNGLPKNFFHGNPTAVSLMSRRVKQPLKHSIQLDIDNKVEYVSDEVLLIDYGVQGSGINQLHGRKNEVILENDKYYYIRPDSEYESFYEEYPRIQELAFHFFANSLLSRYPEDERKPFVNILNGPIEAKTLKEAFLQMKGKKMRKDAMITCINAIHHQK
jgi:hypothetical protein